jgi:hypothetical protein
MHPWVATADEFVPAPLLCVLSAAEGVAMSVPSSEHESRTVAAASRSCSLLCVYVCICVFVCASVCCSWKCVCVSVALECCS